MAYCRFSSDNWQSDVYVYRSFNGYVINIAANKYVFSKEYPMPRLEDDSSEAWIEWYTQQRIALDNATLVNLDLPYAGEQFSYNTGQEAAELLTELASLGYHVPDGVIEELSND